MLHALGSSQTHLLSFPMCLFYLWKIQTPFYLFFSLKEQNSPVLPCETGFIRLSTSLIPHFQSTSKNVFFFHIKALCLPLILISLDETLKQGHQEYSLQGHFSRPTGLLMGPRIQRWGLLLNSWVCSPVGDMDWWWELITMQLLASPPGLDPAHGAPLI